MGSRRNPGVWGEGRVWGKGGRNLGLGRFSGDLGKRVRYAVVSEKSSWNFGIGRLWPTPIQFGANKDRDFFLVGVWGFCFVLECSLEGISAGQCLLAVIAEWVLGVLLARLGWGLIAVFCSGLLVRHCSACLPLCRDLWCGISFNFFN